MVVLPGARLVGFDERFRFDTFVVGMTTRDAADAARAVAERGGSEATPLVVVGPPGTGKSHLLGAIARRARELRPHERIAVIAGADGADDWTTLDGAQLVLVDDAHDVGDRERLRTALQAALLDGARLVLTWPDAADAPDGTTGAIAALVPGMRVVRLDAPDLEARREIVRRTTNARGLRLASAVVSAIADRPVADVRELLGAVSRVGAAGGLHAADAAASPAPPPVALPAADLDFASFLDEVAREVAAHAEPWRLRLGEAATRWRTEGFAVDVLDRALRLSAPPDVDALLATFTAAVDRLRALAAEAAALGVEAAGHPAFHDPTRVVEAEGLVAQARAARPLPNGPPGARAVSVIDAETWVLDWPNVADLLVEQWS